LARMQLGLSRSSNCSNLGRARIMAAPPDEMRQATPIG
jgi:hypothetical protein